MTDLPRGGQVVMPRRRWITPALIIVVTLSLLIGVGGGRFYVHPRVDRRPAGARVAVG